MTDQDDRTAERLEQGLARLEAIEEIKQLKAGYFRYLDLPWWNELGSLFTDDAQFTSASPAPRRRHRTISSAGFVRTSRRR
jgi:hypothetical protein